MHDMHDKVSSPNRTGARVRRESFRTGSTSVCSIRSAECGLRSWESDGVTDCAAGQAWPPLAGMTRLVRFESNRRSLVAATKQWFMGYRIGDGSMHKLMQW